MNAGGVDEEEAGDQRQLAHRERVGAPPDVEVDDLGLGQVEARGQEPHRDRDRDRDRRLGGTTRIASSAVSEIRTSVNSQTLVEPDVSAMKDRRMRDLTESGDPGKSSGAHPGFQHGFGSTGRNVRPTCR